MQNFDIPLHDIKPIVDVQEYSFYYFLGVSSFVLILACGTAYLIYKRIKRKNALNIRKEHKNILNALDFDVPKNAAYAITHYGLTFASDSPRHVEMYKNLTSRLEAYKYKKEVENIDKETLGYFELYKEMCDV
ncbi:hypothetical protein KKG72_11920 [bacterium]|nr:hypothetical protein [bacterium]MBU1994824.1 hypothetical protein [bacterium]